MYKTLSITLLLGLLSAVSATQHCFFEVSIAGAAPQRIEIELFDNTPITSKNFLALCTGEVSKQGKQLTYKGTTFHRIVPGVAIQGGDVTGKGGQGSKSIYETDLFEDENFSNVFLGAGDLAMANAGPDTNGSQFFITTTKTSWLSGFVVFGRVSSGLDVVQAIDALGNNAGTPSKTVTIVDSGAF